MSTVIGVDLGTQSIKVLAYDAEQKRILASASSSLDLHTADDGTAEQEASWWISALHDAFGKIPEQIKSQAKAIAVSGQQHGFVAVDQQGVVLAPVKLWCDTSTTVECGEIMEGYGGEQRCRQQLGNSIVTGYTAPKILWLKKNKPELFQQMASVMLPHDYLNFYLSGEHTMEVGDASGTGLLNIHTRQWDREIISLIDPGLSYCLPELLDDKACAGYVQANIADRLGLPAGIPVSVGGGDNMMAAIGTGNVDSGVVTISLGSSGTVYSHSQQPVADDEGRLAAFCSSTGGWLPLLCTMNCTLSTELMRDLLNKDLSEFEQALTESPRGAYGVLTLPFYNGERTPNLPNSRATILGLSSNNMTAANLLRSATESATYGLRLGIEALRDKGMVVNEIRLTGGGSNSAAWRQMVADICQAPVTLLTPDEGAAFGAALQALQLLNLQQGNTASLVDLVTEHLQKDSSRSCVPNQQAVAEYNEFYALYLQAVDRVSSLYDAQH